MIEWLESIDRSIVLAVNGLNSPWLDEVMWVISGKVLWIPLYLFIFYLGIRSFGLAKSLKFLVLTVVCIAVADLISVHFFKNVFERYRPSHHLLLTNKLHFYEQKPGEFYRGGQFGFVSSHAANFFALATFVGLCFRTRYRYFSRSQGCTLAFTIFPIYLAVRPLGYWLHSPFGKLFGKSNFFLNPKQYFFRIFVNINAFY
jgi:undecaprenyl-diphosphatase